MNLHPDCKSATRARTNCNMAHDMLVCARSSGDLCCKCAGAVVNVLVLRQVCKCHGHCAGAGASPN
eukprot:4695198-Alexandrium_andersonii.AAC.1